MEDDMVERLKEATARFAREVWQAGLRDELVKKDKTKKFFVVFQEITLGAGLDEYADHQFGDRWIMTFRRRFNDDTRGYALQSDGGGQLYWQNDSPGGADEDFRDLINCFCDKWSEFRNRYLS